VIAPKFEEFAKKYTNIQFVKVNVDEVADVATKCEIRGTRYLYHSSYRPSSTPIAMPTFQLYKDGKKVGEIVGADASALESEIKKFA